MTEDEAKTKWCPAVRFVPETNTTHPGTNRGVRIERGAEGAPAFKCIGSACMAWRWTEPFDTPTNPNTGHCGLAGKP